MANLMQHLQSILSAAEQNLSQGDQGLGNDVSSIGNKLSDYVNKENLSKLLAPAALGSLAGALLGSGKGSRSSAAQKALLLGGVSALGAFAWDKYKKQIQDAFAQPGQPAPAAQTASTQSATPPDERAERLIRAMVFAARADGNLDDSERQTIEAQVKSLSLGLDAEQVVNQAMKEPVDPNTIAKSVKNADEALETYVVSRSVIPGDQFMDRNYLAALAMALNIPENVQQGIESDIKKAAQ